MNEYRFDKFLAPFGFIIYQYKIIQVMNNITLDELICKWKIYLK